MQCSDVYELADSFLSEELLVETNHEVLRHLEGCPKCRADVASRRQVREMVRHAFTASKSLRVRDDFPAEVVAKLRTVAVPRKRSFRIARWSAVAASAVVAVTVGVLVLNGRLAAMARDAVGDHRNCAVQFRLAEHPISLEEAARRYGDDPVFRLLQETPPAQIQTTTGVIRVVDRHACIFGGRRFAHIVLQFHGELASLLVTADTGQLAGRLNGWNPQPQLTWLPRIEGFGVASFKTPGHLVFLVSSLEEPALHELAGTLSGPLYRRLVGA